MKERRSEKHEYNFPIIFRGCGGCGKTTLLRHLARGILMESGIMNDNHFASSDDSPIDMVRYVELKNIRLNGPISVAEFLFGDLFENGNAAEELYEWLLRNQ